MAVNQRRRAGALRDRIALEATVKRGDGYGGTIEAWQERAVLWASILYLRGGETVQAARLVGRQPVVITVRASDVTRAIDGTWRAIDLRRVKRDQKGEPVPGPGLYNIKTAFETEDRAWIEITAESGLSD